MNIQMPSVETSQVILPRTHRRFASRQLANKEKVVGNYAIGKKIGHGTYGTVHLATHLRSQAQVIVKVLPLSRQLEESGDSVTTAVNSRVERQIFIHQSLDHPNIAKVHDVVRSDEKAYIFMQYCQKGELFDYLRAEGPLSHEMAGKVFSQIFSAIKYLHSMGIAHRDIKAENIVFDHNMDAKLIDFGLAKNYLESGDKQRMKTFCGSPSYTPPEIVKKRRYDGELADVWSLGVTLYAMLEASLPFDTENPAMSAHNIEKLNWHCPESSPDEAVELFKKIFVPVKHRLSLRQVEESSFYRKYCTNLTSTPAPIPIPIPNRPSSSLSFFIEQQQDSLISQTTILRKNVVMPAASPKIIPLLESKKKIGRKQVRSVDLFKDKNADQSFRIRLTPMKSKKPQQEGRKFQKFFLKPLLIEA